jgi:U4/U6.U5 tri-snRNP component SNU23
MGADGKPIVDNIGRKTWELDEYERRVAERIAAEDEAEREANGGMTKKQSSALVVKETLKARDYAVDLVKDLGRHQVISASAGKNARGGFYCDLCECRLSDSVAYLDHINGKNHQRKKGMSMTAERATVASVRARIAHHRALAAKKSGAGLAQRIVAFNEGAKRARRGKYDSDDDSGDDMDIGDDDDDVVAEVDAQTRRAKRAKLVNDSSSSSAGIAGRAKALDPVAAAEAALAAASDAAAVAAGAPAGATTSTTVETAVLYEAPPLDPETAAMAAMMGFSGLK